MRNTPTIISASLLTLAPLLASITTPVLSAQPKDRGYRGNWYFNQPSNDEYGYKYSGGFATDPQQQLPFAIYAQEVHKTFFCYGGRSREKNERSKTSSDGMTSPRWRTIPALKANSSISRT